MLYGVYYVAALLQNVLFFLLVRRTCGFEITKNKFLLGVFTLLAAVPQLVFLFPSKQIPSLLKILLLVIMMLMKAGCYAGIFRQKKLRMLYISILSFALNTNYTNVMHLFMQDQMKLNITACLTEAIFTAFLLLYIRRTKCDVIIMSGLMHIPPRLYITILVFLYFMIVFEFTIVIPQLNYIARFLILPVVLVISVIVGKIIKIAATEKTHQRMSEILSEQLENQVTYYQKINEFYNEFRSFRHDFRNHLICLRSLLAENEVQRAITYMDDIENMSYTKRKSYDTGNIIVNALLNDKSEKAAQQNTKILFSGFVPTTGITNADICTIFANALDNAIEACAKDSSGEPKNIEIHSDFQQGNFALKITNPIFEKVQIRRGNQVSTSKENKSMHGFGVANIVKTTKKYRGDTLLTADDKLFTLEINLWLNPEV